MRRYVRLTLHPKVLSENEISQIMSDLERMGLSLDDGQSKGKLAVFKSKE